MSLRHLLLLAIFLPLSLSAQVGVNEPDPEQTLDVNGKIKVGNDGVTPSDGTIRYNDTERSFEGFSDGEWQSFTKSATPEDVEYIQLYVVNKMADGDWEEVDLQASSISGVAQSFSAVPDGKKLIVDMIECVARDGQPDEFFYACISPSSLPVAVNGGNLRNPRVCISGNSSNGNTVINATRAPLMVVHAGQGLAVWNSTNSESSVRVVITGFLVDDDATDDFFGY